MILTFLQFYVLLLLSSFLLFVFIASLWANANKWNLPIARGEQIRTPLNLYLKEICSYSKPTKEQHIVYWRAVRLFWVHNKMINIYSAFWRVLSAFSFFYD